MSLFDLPSASVQSGKSNEWYNQVICGDALVELRKLSSDSIDALCVDPPAAVSFMGKSWDSDKGGRDQWVAWLAEIMRECLRVMKPGSHGLVWSLPRTSHWTAWALEDAGFEIKDCCYHLFGSGFPKSHDISKAIDRHFQVDREVVGISPNARPAHKLGGMGFDKAVGKDEHSTITLSVPATPEAQQHSGFGTALKPAAECWWLIRKPLSEKSIAENVLKWGTGGLNIEACRIETDDKLGRLNHTTSKFMDSANGTRPSHPKTFLANNSDGKGRWPSHLLLSHSLWCDESGCDASCPILQLDEQSGVRKSGGGIKNKAGHGIGMLRGEDAYRFKHDGLQYVPSEGGASRYFQQFYYCSKASRKDRTANGTVENNHPTVKPLSLIRYLTRMICPPGGIVLDCFAGSGTSALACIAEGFDYLLIEQDEAYCNIARARIDQMLQEVNNAS